MIWQSLKLRLFFVAGLAIVGALFLFGSVLNQIFERHALDRLYFELESQLNQLITRIEVNEDSHVDVPKPPENPRFLRPFGGLYWQVETADAEPLGSRSLWDQSLVISRTDVPPGTIARHRDVTSNAGTLIAVERTVLVKVGKTDRPVRLIVAMDQAELETVIEAFDTETFSVVALLALFLLVAASVQILIGLRPLNTLHQRLNAVATGKVSGLEGNFPTEVRPLVDVLNGLLVERQENVERARASAADLAHCLKTPLAILSAEGRTLLADGQKTSAEEIERQVMIMNGQVERQLARARVRGRARIMDGGTDLRAAFIKLTGAFRQLPRGDKIDWVVDVPENLVVQIDQMDFEEIAGNLLDNARKWAVDRVMIHAASDGDGLKITIEDNGAGVTAADLEVIGVRGYRADDVAPGSGLGLAIVRDIVEVYGGRVTFESAAPTGLRVLLHLPLHNRTEPVSAPQ